MSKFDVQLPHFVRQALTVAISMTRAVDARLRLSGEPLFDSSFGVIPVVLRIEAHAPQDGQSRVRIRFVGGILVDVELFDRNTLTEWWRKGRQDWVVVGVSVRYWQVDRKHRTPSRGRACRKFTTDEIHAIRASCIGWHQPGIEDAASITSQIGVFWDSNRGEGYLVPDFEETQQEQYMLVSSVRYAVLVGGDRARAIEEAKDILMALYCESRGQVLHGAADRPDSRPPHLRNGTGSSPSTSANSSHSPVNKR